MKQTLSPVSIHRVHRLALAGLGLGMLLTIGFAHQSFLRAQVAGTGAVASGSGSVAAPIYGWMPTGLQRQVAEIVIAGVHDEVRAYTKPSQVLSENLHGSAADGPGMFRRWLDEIAGWFGLNE